MFFCSPWGFWLGFKRSASPTTMGGALGKKKSKDKAGKSESVTKLKKDNKDKESSKGKEKEKEPESSALEKPEDPPAGEEEEEEEEEWEEGMVYGRDGKKVGVDDFELLTVVGKGSFGKVWVFVFLDNSLSSITYPNPKGYSSQKNR